MLDREKVIAGLKASLALKNKVEMCSMPSRLVEDTIALLKEQEPHLVTEADFGNADAEGYIPAWCEAKERDGTIVGLGYVAIRKDGVNRVPSNRFWTSRPTDARREKVKWDD